VELGPWQVCIVTGLQAEGPGFNSQQGLGFLLLATASRLPLEPTQTIRFVPGILSLGVKSPGYEDDHSPPSNPKIRNAWSYMSTPPMQLHGMMPN